MDAIACNLLYPNRLDLALSSFRFNAAFTFIRNSSLGDSLSSDPLYFELPDDDDGGDGLSGQ